MLNIILTRRSIRQYLDQPVEEEKLREILLAGFASPSAHHQYPWQFIIVKNQVARNALSKATPYCSFISKAPVCLVLIGEEKSSRQWIEDAGILSENIALETFNQGLGTCHIQARESKTPAGGDSEKYIKQLLNIPEDLRVCFLMPIGYSAETKEAHGEKDYKKEKVHFEKY